jgi:GT2 family glycosyltransferase
LNGPSPSVSIVVPTFERRANLARLLAALAAQTHPVDDIELVVVDDGSTDGTIDWIRAARPPYRVHAITQTHRGPAAARNLGVAESRGDLIVFLDDDVVPDPGLVASHVAAHGSAKNLAVIGPMLPPQNWRRPAWIRWEEQKLVRQYRALAAGKYQCTYRQFFTGNASLRRDQLLAAGGFDARFVRAEDVELGYRLWKMGTRFVFEAGARVWHYPRRSFVSWRRVPYLYGQADVAMEREKGHEVLRLALAEFGNRSSVTRGLARLCVGRANRFRAATLALGAVAQAAGVVGLEPVASASLSALFSLLYWQGVSDELGGPSRLWTAVGERRAPTPTST